MLFEKEVTCVILYRSFKRFCYFFVRFVGFWKEDIWGRVVGSLRLFCDIRKEFIFVL